VNVTTIVLIPDLWMTALCWEHWVKHYSSKGYCVVARSWPGMEGDIEELRRAPNSFATLGLIEVVAHYEQIIRELETPPIIVGHGFGGLVTQILLDRGWGAAGVAIASAPAKGVSWLPLSILKPALSGVSNHKALSLTSEQFHRGFANTSSEAQSLTFFNRYTVPGPTRVLWQAALANFLPSATTTVNFPNNTRAPLLFVSGGKDRVAPTSQVKANFERYRGSKAEIDYKEYPGQAHFTFLQETKVADYVLGWAVCRADSASTLAAFPNRKASWSVQLSA
jgi:pimeloyl-ACP methyl ester carboxylesterase